VVAGLILETTFIIDFERELTRGQSGPAHLFLQSRHNEKLYLTFTVAGELAAGIGPQDRSRWERLISPFQILPSSADVSWEYGKAVRYLRTNGALIGANDLWIAATAVAYGQPLVTRNTRDFGRVPGLEIVAY
jgi:predicted nucleic acid-binding protein